MFRRVSSLTRLLPVLLAGCGGGAFASTVTENSPRPAPDVYQCARSQLKAVGFSQTSYDENDQRVTAKKYAYVTRPDVAFRRLVDRLTVEVQPAGSGEAMSTISVQAATFAERQTHRGPTEEQERTSETARQAAQTIADRCGQGKQG